MKAVVIDDDGEAFVERVREVAQQFLAILPRDPPVAPPGREA